MRVVHYVLYIVYISFGPPYVLAKFYHAVRRPMLLLLILLAQRYAALLRHRSVSLRCRCSSSSCGVDERELVGNRFRRFQRIARPSADEDNPYRSAAMRGRMGGGVTRRAQPASRSVTLC